MKRKRRKRNGPQKKARKPEIAEPERFQKNLRGLRTLAEMQLKLISDLEKLVPPKS